MAIKHLAIIMDGNRRYARKHKLELVMGHNKGASKVEDVMNWCKEAGIKELTLYTFSVENFNRDSAEVEYLMNLFRKQLDTFSKDARLYEDKIKVRMIGRLSMFPADIQEQMNELMEKTKNHGSFMINFALGYGGRSEIVDSVKKIAGLVQEGKVGVDDINEEMVESCLYLQSEPDMVIRTGGDKRVSNFLIWQSHYSEWYFCEKLWPEFEKEDFLAAVKSFEERERRFGK